MDRATQLFGRVPVGSDSWQAKRGFSLDMAKFLLECELSPRYAKANRKYVAKRGAEAPDKQNKEELLAKHDAAATVAEAKTMAGEKEREEEYAKNRTLAAPKKKGRKPLTEEEKEKRKEERRARDKMRYKAAKLTKEAEKEAARDGDAPVACTQIAPYGGESSRAESSPAEQLVIAGPQPSDPLAARKRARGNWIATAFNEDSDDSEWRLRKSM